jgi:hypothetical protein
MNNSQNNYVVFMAPLFAGAQELLLDSYDYFSRCDREKRLEMISPFERTIFANEMSRITMRLTSVISWLMARRAVYEGEISSEEAYLEFSLGLQSVCLDHNAECLAIVPPYMAQLLQDSYDIYSRVNRLDAMIKAEFEGREIPAPDEFTEHNSSVLYFSHSLLRDSHI